VSEVKIVRSMARLFKEVLQMECAKP